MSEFINGKEWDILNKLLFYWKELMDEKLANEFYEWNIPQLNVSPGLSLAAWDIVVELGAKGEDSILEWESNAKI